MELPVPKILTDESKRYVEIYKIINLINNKCYIGQTVSHVLNHKKYRLYGMNARFKAHISESKSEKKCQCFYLNNSIKKYKSENFKVELIEICSLENADERETFNIMKYNTIYPNGYNLKIGGNVFRHSDESKKRLSLGVSKYFEDKKYERFSDVIIPDEQNFDRYIRPLMREGNQYGWYVYISGKKADFGGVHIELNLSKELAFQFIIKLVQKQKNRTIAKHLEAGNPLESQTTISYSKEYERTRLIAEPNGNNV
jgi:hypothetical protein